MGGRLLNTLAILTFAPLSILFTSASPTLSLFPSSVHHVFIFGFSILYSCFVPSYFSFLILYSNIFSPIPFTIFHAQIASLLSLLLVGNIFFPLLVSHDIHNLLILIFYL